VTGDRIISRHLESVGNMVSGLDLTDLGKDGHQVANELWHIAAYLWQRGATTDDAS
jgi:hypothetical protein